jgi:hypothetical protein
MPEDESNPIDVVPSVPSAVPEVADTPVSVAGEDAAAVAEVKVAKWTVQVKPAKSTEFATTHTSEDGDDALQLYQDRLSIAETGDRVRLQDPSGVTVRSELKAEAAAEVVPGAGYSPVE